MVRATALIAAVTLVSTGLALFVLPAVAEDSLATIFAPADGAKLETKHTYKLEYDDDVGEVMAKPRNATIAQPNLVIDEAEFARHVRSLRGLTFPMKAHKNLPRGDQTPFDTLRHWFREASPSRPFCFYVSINETAIAAPVAGFKDGEFPPRFDCKARRA